MNMITGVSMQTFMLLNVMEPASLINVMSPESKQVDHLLAGDKVVA